MTTPLHSPSVLERPVPLRLRYDLQIVGQQQPTGIRWVIKDPLTLEYSQLEDREYQLLTLLDGSRSMAEIKRLYESRFPGERLNVKRFHRLCLALQREGLLLGPSEDPQRLLDRRHEHEQAKWIERLTNLLAIRFRGIDPQRLLDVLYPLTRWLFSPPCVLLGLTASLCVFAFVALRFDLLRQQLPQFQQLLSGSNLLLLMLAVLVTKVIHELAHGLTCKHFGGECRELGAMLLVFTPCLYCDVSDAWLINSRWRRMAISAAGMYVETLLAATALVLWWFAREGPLKLFLLNTVMVCTVATVVFNANPLLRFDGYYILSDWLGVPNLWTRSRSLVSGFVQRVCLGWEEPEEVASTPGARCAMGIYAVASMAYRWVVVVGIVWLLVGFLKPFGLEALAYGGIGLVLATSLVPPALSARRKLTDPLKRSRLKKLRLGISLVVGLALLSLLLFMPLPHSQQATAVIRLTAAARLYATQAGVLRGSMPYGSEVVAGEVVASLANVDLERQLLQAQGRRDQQQKRLSTLLTLRGSDRSVAAEIPTAAEMLHDYQLRVEQMQREVDQLQIRSPRAGTLLPPETIPPRQESAATGMVWHTTPLAGESRGRAIALGEYLGQVGERNSYHAELMLGADQIESVGLGQAVKLRLRESPGVVIRGQVVDISPANRAAADTARDDADASRSAGEEQYRLWVKLESPGPAVTIGARGIARIRTPPRSLAQRISRSVARLFQLGH